MKLKLLLLLLVATTYGVYHLAQRNKANLRNLSLEAHLMADSAAIMQGLDRYKQSNGQLPSTSEGLDALIHRPASAGASWQPLFDYVPIDFWGHPYRYRLAPDRPRGYDVFSLGPDGVESKDDVHLQ